MCDGNKSNTRLTLFDIIKTHKMILERRNGSSSCAVILFSITGICVHAEMNILPNKLRVYFRCFYWMRKMSFCFDSHCVIMRRCAFVMSAKTIRIIETIDTEMGTKIKESLHMKQKTRNKTWHMARLILCLCVYWCRDAHRWWWYKIYSIKIYSASYVLDVRCSIWMVWKLMSTWKLLSLWHRFSYLVFLPPSVPAGHYTL